MEMSLIKALPSRVSKDSYEGWPFLLSSLKSFQPRIALSSGSLEQIRINDDDN